MVLILVWCGCVQIDESGQQNTLSMDPPSHSHLLPGHRDSSWCSCHWHTGVAIKHNLLPSHFHTLFSWCFSAPCKGLFAFGNFPLLCFVLLFPHSHNPWLCLHFPSNALVLMFVQLLLVCLGLPISSLLCSLLLP